jgi:hypothetical protein
MAFQNKRRQELKKKSSNAINIGFQTPKKFLVCCSCTPKLFERFKCEFKGENTKEEKVGVLSLSCNISKVKMTC